MIFGRSLGEAGHSLARTAVITPPTLPNLDQQSLGTPASVVEAERSGATKRRKGTNVATGLVGEQRPKLGGINGAVGRGRGTGLSCPGTARPAATAYDENA